MLKLTNHFFLFFIVTIGFLGFEGCTKKQDTIENKLPACVNLDCYNNSDCGTKCVCQPQSNSNLGKCVLPDK